MRRKGKFWQRWGSVLAVSCSGMAIALGGRCRALASDPPYPKVAVIPDPGTPAAAAKAPPSPPSNPSAPEHKPVVVVLPAGGGKEPEPAPQPGQLRSVRPRPAAPIPPVRVLPIDLPTALRLVNASNPTIALARERVREAYAHLQEARSLWLPTLLTGPAYVRHDGQLQNASGLVFPVS